MNNALWHFYFYGFIAAMPDGYDTLIEDDGGGVSAGQRQLLTIARAFQFGGSWPARWRRKNSNSLRWP